MAVPRIGEGGLDLHRVISASHRVDGGGRRYTSALTIGCLWQHCGRSATCIIVIAMINYELFVGEQFVGDTGNCCVMRQL